MSSDIRFSLTDEQVPEALYGRVVARVGAARMRAARMRVGIASFGIGASLGGSFLAIRATLAAASASGFTSFASLALTDTSVIALHAQTFGSTLLETLPSMQVAGVLLGLSVLLVSMRSLVRALVPSSPKPPRIQHA